MIKSGSSRPSLYTDFTITAKYLNLSFTTSECNYCKKLGGWSDIVYECGVVEDIVCVRERVRACVGFGVL